MKITKSQRVLISGIAIVLSLILDRIVNSSLIPDILMIFAAFLSGYPIGLNAIRALKYKILGIDALVTLAVIGALIIGEYWEAGAVTFLFMLGNYLESKTLDKTRSAIKSLLDLAPNVAKVIRNGQEIEIDPNEVMEKDIVIVRSGEKIPVDGVVVEGNSHVNQASITGESMPVNKKKEDEAYSGTIIESGYLKIEAQKVGDDTTFARILEMVEEAQDKKAKTQKFLEVFSRYYTPAIMILAIIVYIITKDIRLSLTLLVIACPGALVISTPVSIVAGIGNGAKNGILIKGGEIIEKLGKTKVIAFDKTGTLTEGKPKVIKIKSFGISEKELLKLAAKGEMYSEHPLGKSIIEKYDEIIGGKLMAPEYTDIITGHGLKAKIEGKEVLIGNRKLIDLNGINISEDIEDYIIEEEEKGQTAVIIGDKENILGVISIADTIKEGAKDLIDKLKKQGIKNLIMLTGDNERVANWVANKLGLDGYYAELLPEDKVKILKDLQAESGITLMVGDGVNDAPALASADLGIAVGGVGKDVAMETADVVLMADKLDKLSYALGLSKSTVKNIKQNIYFSIAVVTLLLIGVLVGTVFLSLGMLVHELSVLLVIINAIRLLKYREK
ncbi:heavy metal translocating P-type ATPase [Senegalia massiliensis]|uniref:Cd(2+)-exporting ATPase n=1 Tax=Senegalia massiliensis TaxID=1720316 RepID=A0A845R6T8_9CLOT|nr:cation-translocating P-type ATPase [Senegalia massiliensis]NBI08203.1 cadmium-translocating P-type ATPase [Senegalia massiliensis]